MFSAINEAVNKLMDGFFQQHEENRRLHKRCDELQEELREMKARLLFEHEEFERRIEAVSSENLTLDFVLVGFNYNDNDDNETPIFIKKQSKCSVYEALCDGAFGDDVSIYNFCVIMESFRYFDRIFDLAEWCQIGFFSVYYEDKILYCSESSVEHFISNPDNQLKDLSVERLISNPDNQLKDLYKVCKDLGIKFVFKGSDTVNGVPIDKILS
jgi:hypothetical protein